MSADRAARRAKGADSVIGEQVQQLLEEKINPVLEQDKGCASLTSVRRGVATVRMEGMCAHCPNASISFETIIRRPLLEGIKALKDVRLDESEEEEILLLAKKFLSGEGIKGGQAKE